MNQPLYHMFTKVSIYLKCDNYLYYNFRIHHFGNILAERTP